MWLALNLVTLGDNEDYGCLISIISFNDNTIPDQEALRVTCLRALLELVSCINFIQHEALFHSLFGRVCGTADQV